MSSSGANNVDDGRPLPAKGAADRAETALDARRQPIVMCWSGGKDSALALHEIERRDDVQVVALVTTLNRSHDRICMHGVRRELLRRQAAALELPLHEVWLSDGATNGEYESKIGAAFAAYRPLGVRTVAFGDIFLEDLRAYRERHLAGLDLTGLFPIWKRDTRELIGRFVADGLRAVLTCVDTTVLPKSFAGREIDRTFLEDLPCAVDACGENGEFHSFVYDGPLFNAPVNFTLGATHRADRFVFRDLVPAEKPDALRLRREVG